MLGEFEYSLLTAAARLGEDAYGAAMRKEIEEATGRRCSIGALYTTLDRLESKSLIMTWMGDPTPQRGGRPKRMVRVTASGLRAASDFYSSVMRVSRGVAWEAKKNAEPRDSGLEVGRGPSASRVGRRRAASRTRRPRGTRR
jgi:DNA-binding PadR family transcriptional regulator